MKVLVAAAIVLATLAGCLQDGPAGPDLGAVRSQVEAAAEAVLTLDHPDEARGHFDAAAHAGSANMRLVGYANGVDDSGDPARIPAKGVYNELAVAPEHAYLSAVSADGSFGGFSILDIRSPSPTFVARWQGPPGFDLEVDPEEHFVYFATQRNSVEQLAGGAQANPEPPATLPRGIHVVDVSDKRAPRLDSFVPMPANGPHTLTYVRHENGLDYLIACTYDLLTEPGTGAIVATVPVTQRVVVFLVQERPEAPAGVPGVNVPKVGLVPVAQIQVTEQAAPGGLVFPHDTRVQVHPVDGRTLLYVAYWDKGTRIYDFTNPPSPAADPANPPSLPLVSSFTDFSPSRYNNIHLTAPFDTLLDGRHVTIAEPEIIDAENETGQLTFLDTTDPASPAKLGHWKLPGELAVRALDFSPHNFDTFGTKVALAHNHAGVWVLDVGGPNGLADPASVGFYMPAKPRPDSPAMQPRVWGVFEQGGLLYASDEATGLYVLEYTGP
ncbi:MAG: hypothetical protein QOD77_549 [Thermoplasmata archaeon]|jgi:hypothetical protein|nr:hypothetical protein [Thermoplasmata archaeon]